MKAKNESFTVLDLWKERGFPYISLLKIAGINIANSFKTRYDKRPAKVEVYESESGRAYMVNQYPGGSFRKEANKALNRLQKKYGHLLPRAEPKRKRPRVKRQREKQPVRC